MTLSLSASRVLKPFLLFPAMLLVCMQWAFAQPLSLPLDGYHRPGSYMPVKLTASGSIMTDGALSTVAISPAATVPMFVFTATANRLQAPDAPVSLRALSPEERLVGMATPDDVLAKSLFPAHRVITVALDSSNPLPGPVIAWDALDAIVVDSIDAQRVAPLLAMGTIIAVKSPIQPDRIWPWKRVGDAWILRPTLFDQPALRGEDPYAVNFAPAGRSAAVRQMIVVIAVLCGCVMLAISLWRSRWSLLVLGIVSALFCGGFVWWRGQRSEVVTTHRKQRVDGELTRVDLWTYQTSPIDTDAEMYIDGITWPVFASPAHAAMLKAKLHCDARGAPVSIRYHLPAHARMAFLTRTISPQTVQLITPSQ